MTEIVLRARVFDHSGEHVDDTFWERAMDVGFVPESTTRSSCGRRTATVRLHP